MMEEKNKPKKMPRRRFRNVLAALMVLVCSAALSVGMVGTLTVAATGASVEEVMRGASFYELRHTFMWVESDAADAFRSELDKNAYWVDGEYDPEQYIDITNLTAGILAQDKNPATSYRMADLVAMYNESVDDKLLGLVEQASGVDSNYPEIIEELEETLGTTEYYVDNIGNLYAARDDMGVNLEEYLSQMPLPTGNASLLDEYGMILYILDGDMAKVCYQLPEGTESLAQVTWNEFSARYMLGAAVVDVIESAENTEDEKDDIDNGDAEPSDGVIIFDDPVLQNDAQSEINYEEYGYTFQYLYKHGQDLEIILPASGESLGNYALKNPVEVSLMDTYKQLATAIESVGYAVVNQEYKNVDMTVAVDAEPLAYYWASDGTIFWTNNPAWNFDTIDLVEAEILSRENDNIDNNSYLMYYGGSAYQNEYESMHTELFSSSVKDSYSSIDSIMLYDFGMEAVEYVVAMNPAVTDPQVFMDISNQFYLNKELYESLSEYMLAFLVAVLLGGIGTVVCYVLTIVWAGKRDKTKVRYAGSFAAKVPIGVLLIIDVVCWVAYGIYFCQFIVDAASRVDYGTRLSDYAFMMIAVVGFLGLSLWQIVTLICKGCSRNMRTNSLIGRAGEHVVESFAKTRNANAFTRNCPIELMLAIFFVCWLIYVVVAWMLTDAFAWSYFPGKILIVCILVAGFIVLATWHIMTLVSKVRTKNMKTNSLSIKLAGAIKSAYKNRKVTGKLVICCIIFAFISLLFIGLSHATYVGGFWIFLLIVFWIVVIAFLMKKCMQRQRLKEGIHEIAGGNLEYQIRMDKMTGDELDMAWDMNNIKDGMENAVERMMKSERMKTDLITNVSHDLKTPLTSIINYVDILKKEDIQDEKIRGYIDILEQKSLRLKNLTEDLMEAAKISSGNITLEIQNINLKQLLYQTNGEFEEKFARRNLQLVCTLPDSDVYIKADGRRMWRVIENLYNNAAKYAQPYSRVYVDGKLEAGKVTLIIKNVSEAPLNISADELMERFVRGDVARNTEGSGLGLEIARNLTVMQNGTFDIQLDGDLFKVILTFDAV